MQVTTGAYSSPHLTCLTEKSRDQDGGGQFVPSVSSQKFWIFTLILPLVKMDNVAKRRRSSTGGSAAPQHGSYAGVTRIDVSSLSDSDKLNFLVNKMCVIETLVTEVHSLKTKLNSACCEIENLQISHTSVQEELSWYKMRLIDLEALSRRQNLIFRNIP